jgi:hypothetical protein
MFDKKEDGGHFLGQLTMKMAPRMRNNKDGTSVKPVEHWTNPDKQDTKWASMWDPREKKNNSRR